MAKETDKRDEGLTLVMKIGPKEGDLVGYGKIIVGKENPKVLDFREEINNNNKKE